MNKKVLLIIVILLVAAACVGGIWYFSNKSPNNTTTNTKKELIVLDEEIDGTRFTYNKVEIDPNTNKLRFYISPKIEDYKNFDLELSIYDDENNIIDNYNISLFNFDSSKGFVTIDYNKDLSKASYYSVDLNIGALVG